jgi:hypothetical protein
LRKAEQGRKYPKISSREWKAIKLQSETKAKSNITTASGSLYKLSDNTDPTLLLENNGMYGG